MKIFYAACKWDYGREADGYSAEHVFFYLPLVAVGHEVCYFDISHSDDGIVERAREFRPEVIFSCIFYDRVKPDNVEALRKIAPTVNWFTDDQWYWNSYSKHWCRHFDWSVTTAGIGPALYQSIGYDNWIKSQWATPHGFEDRRQERRKDVVFIGRPHGNRWPMIEALRNAGIDVAIYGPDWGSMGQGRVTHEQMIDIYNHAKIALNFSESAALGNWQIKGRHYEPQGCGALLLTDVPSDDWQDRYDCDYAFGKEIVVFDQSNQADLIEKVRYYLYDEAGRSEREQIAAAGHKRTMRDHTYPQRFQAIFERMGLCAM